MNKIKDYFIGELLKNSNHPHDQAKALVNFNFSFFGCIGFMVAFVNAIITESYPILIPSGVSFLFCTTHLFTLKLTKKLRFSSVVLSVLIFIILFGDMFFNDDTIHDGGPLWMIVLFLFVIFNLGYKAGVISLLMSLTAYGFYVVYFLEDNLWKAPFFDKQIFYSLILEFSIAFTIIFYMVYTFIHTTRTAHNKLKESYTNLEYQNKIIENQRDEKITLLKEIHHRVKNNLQMVNSILQLHCEKLSEPDSIQVFQDAKNRIIAMSLVHERMYKSEDLSHISFENYIDHLSKDLLSQYQLPHQKIVLKTDIKAASISLERAVPLGLIINELISNSLKHGIQNEGEIKIKIIEYTDEWTMEYKDSGQGFPDDYEEGFGMSLVQILAEQLDGKVEIKSDSNGALITFIFSLN